jgi:hypothetical protein
LQEAKQILGKDPDLVEAWRLSDMLDLNSFNSLNLKAGLTIFIAAALVHTLGSKAGG